MCRSSVQNDLYDALLGYDIGLVQNNGELARHSAIRVSIQSHCNSMEEIRDIMLYYMIVYFGSRIAI